LEARRRLFATIADADAGEGEGEGGALSICCGMPARTRNGQPTLEIPASASSQRERRRLSPV